MKQDRFEALERFVPLFETPEPSFERFVHRRERKRRNQRITAAVVGIGVFVAAVWFATGGPFDRARTPAVPGGGVPRPSVTGPAGVPGYPGRVGIVGLPPAEAIPSAPSRGELVVGVMFGHTGGDPGRFGLHLYADGRLIWQKLGEGYAGGDPTPTGLIEQRLTPEGVELIRSEVLSLRMFDRDRHLVGGYVPYFGQIEVQDRGRLVRVTWGDVGPAGPDTPATPEQAQALERLDARLEDLGSWLPANAWEDQEPKPFVPSRYSICYVTVPGVGLDRVLGSLPRSAEELLRPLDRSHEVSDRYGPVGTGFEIWCSTVATDEARSLAEILEAADAADSVSRDVFGLRYEFGPRKPGAVDVTLMLEPMLPHQP